MRLSCDIFISNRLTPSHSTRGHCKPVRASVAIGRKSSALKSHLADDHVSGTVFLLVCTSKEKSGTKYKVQGNIFQIFAKFLENGKVTIRLKEPPHDLYISKADPSNLKTFLSVLKLGGKELNNVRLSSLSPAKTVDVEKPKTVMTIRRRRDYPVSKPFPSSLRKLAVNSCGLVRIEQRICRLQELVSLNLAANQIKEFPSRFVSLSKLTELVVSGNNLKELPAFLCTSALSSSLKLLDLSNNSIKCLPAVFCSLRSLVHLKLDGNGLFSLPADMGKLQKLRYFSASRNQLHVLPLSLVKLRMDSVDISGNPFLPEEHWNVINNLTVPSLKECAGRAVKNHCRPYNAEEMPKSLCQYLDNAKQCFCGRHCFSSCVHHIVKVNIHQIAHTVVSLGPTQSLVPAEGFLCSLKCLHKLQNDRWR